MIKQYLRLAANGVLGMNQRNISYISRYNRRSLFPIVDDKLKTKKLALEHGVTVPQLIGVVDSQHKVKDVSKLVADHNAFCVKPVKGSGGKGILVVKENKDGIYRKTNGQTFDSVELERHISNILAGLFSLGGATDTAMIETCIELEDRIRNFSNEGVPDIRVIVFKGIPVMGMMRLACAASHGKANLHQGAIGVGIDIATGRAIHAVQKDQYLDIHPDTGQKLSDLVLPSWNDLLRLACACSDMTGLGYLGVDLVIDKHHGPMLLELNARPGLSIQIANKTGLLPRLRKVEALTHPERWDVEKRLEFAQAQFAFKA